MVVAIIVILILLLLFCGRQKFVDLSQYDKDFKNPSYNKFRAKYKDVDIHTYTELYNRWVEASSN